MNLEAVLVIATGCILLGGLVYLIARAVRWIQSPVLGARIRLWKICSARLRSADLRRMLARGVHS